MGVNKVNVEHGAIRETELLTRTLTAPSPIRLQSIYCGTFNYETLSDRSEQSTNTSHIAEMIKKMPFGITAPCPL